MKNDKKRLHRYITFCEAHEHGGYTLRVLSLPGACCTRKAEVD
jgi:hypothetical protein